MIVIDKFNSFINRLMFILIISGSTLYSQDDCDISSFKINEKLFNDNIVAYYLTAIDINPLYGVCMLEMALLQIVMKNQKVAKKYYQKAREISPDIKHAKLDKILRKIVVQNEKKKS